MRRSQGLALGLAFSLLAPSLAHAAGLSRPNLVGARAIGLGGAYTAVADDPTAVWYNPAGPAFFGDNEIYLGGELVITQRSYTPSADSPLGTNGITGKITENTTPAFLPIIGVSTRFGFGKTRPTRFALSLLAHVAYGGSIGFSHSDITKPGGDPTKPTVLGIAGSQILDFEITPALSYQVTDVLAIGAGLRIGVTAFSVDDFEPAFHANLSATGVGIGATLGIMLKPHKMIDIGAVYRTPLSATTTGSGPVSQVGSATMNRDMSLSITWPQSAGLGIAVKPHWRFMASVQGDWTGWSSVQKLSIDLAGLPPTVKVTKFSDSYSFHLGLQTIITKNVLVRLGYAYDSNAIPDAAVRRENTDAPKGTLAAGLGVRLWKLFGDIAFETFIPAGPTDRIVKTQVGLDNEAGKYSAFVYSIEVSGKIHF